MDIETAMTGEQTFNLSGCWEALETLRAEVRRLRALHEWHPIEAVPKDRPVIVYDKGLREMEIGEYWDGRHMKEDEICVLAGGDIFLYPSHWMEKPAAPIL